VKRYEGLFILNTAGKEEGVKDALDKISAEISMAGGKVETVQKMDKKNFARIADKKTQRRFLREHHFRRNALDHLAIAREVRVERGCFPGDLHRLARTEAREINFQPWPILTKDHRRESDPRPSCANTPKGTAVARITLAVNRVYTSGEGGEKKEEVSFVDVDVWVARPKSSPST